MTSELGSPTARTGGLRPWEVMEVIMTSDEYNESVQAPTKKRKRDEGRPKVGFLGGADRPAWREFFDTFYDELELLGWLDNVDIDTVYAEGNKQKYKDRAKELARTAGIIVTAGTEPVKATIQAVRDAGRNIPIVVASAAGTGPTGGVTVTGFLNGQVIYATDRFNEFSKAVTRARLRRMGVMANVDAENAAAEQAAVMTVAATVDPVNIDIKDGDRDSEIQQKIANAVANGIRSLYVCTDPLITMHRHIINAAARSKNLPTMYQFRDHVVRNGGYGLMSYGPNFEQMFRDAAALVTSHLTNNRLPGIRTVDSSRLELVWNRKTAADLEPPRGLPLPDDFRGVIVD